MIKPLFLRRTPMEIVTKLEEMYAQLESSWPRTMEKILKDYDHAGEDFYIYTFFKWDNHVEPPHYNVYHQPRKSWPDAFPGTILRRISPTGGWIKIIWALPHQEGFNLYHAGKVFEDPVVSESIRKYLAGEFEKEPEEVFTMV
jgi:hypothetical protein